MKNILAIIIFSFISIITCGQIPMNGLVTWYPMTSTTNGVVYDSSGNGNHATVVNATSIAGFDGQANSAYQFNPLIVSPNNSIIADSTQKITMPFFGVTGNHSFSLAIWVKRPAFLPGGHFSGPYSNHWTPILKIGDNTSSSSPITMTFNTGQFLPNYSCDAANVEIHVGLFAYNVSLGDPYGGNYIWNQWHYICITYKAPDPANGDTTRVLKVYHNDSCVKTSSNYYMLGGMNFIPTNHNYIGYSLLPVYYPNYVANTSLVGSVDNFLYFDRTLTPIEVENIRLHPVLDTLTTSVVNHNNPTDHNVTVYPNPNNGSFKVRSEYIMNEYQLIDVTGTLLLRRDQAGKEVDVSNVPPGMYVLRIKVGNTTLDKKVVITK